MINRAVMTGIMSTGVNVNDYGVTPIPVVRYMSSNGSETGGIHTRRSPFNQQIVDLKIFDDTASTYTQAVKRLSRGSFSERTSNGSPWKRREI